MCHHVFAQNISQELHHKTRISLEGKNLKTLHSAGIETDHGLLEKGRYFTSDFSVSELKIIESLGFEYDIITYDVGNYYQNEARPSELVHQQLELRSNCYFIPQNNYNYTTPVQYKNGSMGGYFTYQEMLSLLDTMVARYPNIINKKTPISGFKTTNQNEIFYVKISNNTTSEDSTKPKILYTALHHAREPHGLSQMIFYLWYLLENYGKDSLVTHIVNTTQLYFIPCVNPDGYLLNQTTNPNGGGLWRKNAYKDSIGMVIGVDLNRNYGFTWGKDDIGSSPLPHSVTYRGPTAFSEPETQAVRSFCLENNFSFAINYHTFGNLMIHPTVEDTNDIVQHSILRSMGKVLTKENNFLLGNSPETVGYDVNGDSDAWMYGDTTEKNTIYAFTPEVGTSFWPPASDIEYLNKSCLWTNLSAPLLSQSYYDASENSSSQYLSPENTSISIKVTRPGIKDGQAILKLTSLTLGVDVIDLPKTVVLDSGKESDLLYNLHIDNNLMYNEGIRLKLEINNNGFIDEKIIEKSWIPKPFTSVFTEKLSTINSYTSQSWDTTSTTFVSSPVSFTDSPNGLYKNDQNVSITIKDPIDLSNISHALLSFSAKWDIENNYDYVQVLASKDNKDFIPLCGRYTNLGTIDQAFSSPLFDGVMNDWVQEEVDLSFFIGAPKVWIKFQMVTDAYEVRDGFYFDDLEIRLVAKTSASNETEEEKITVTPTLLVGRNSLQINGLDDYQNTTLTLYNSYGIPTKTISISSSIIDLNITDIKSGLYIYSIEHKKKSIKQGKILILN